MKSDDLKKSSCKQSAHFRKRPSVALNSALQVVQFLTFSFGISLQLGQIFVRFVLALNCFLHSLHLTLTLIGKSLQSVTPLNLCSPYVARLLEGFCSKLMKKCYYALSFYFFGKDSVSYCSPSLTLS